MAPPLDPPSASLVVSFRGRVDLGLAFAGELVDCCPHQGAGQTSLLFVSVLWPEHIVLAVQVVACGICALLGQRVPIGAVPVLPPGGCSAPIHLTTLQPLLGKVPSVAGGSAPRDDGKAAS